MKASVRALPALLIAAVSILLSACEPLGQTAGVVVIGDARPSSLVALSSNGQTAIGYLFDAERPAGLEPPTDGGRDEPRHAFVWRRERGLTMIRSPTGGDVEVDAISGDGRVVVGRYETADRLEHIFRWTGQSGIEDLGEPPSQGSPSCWNCDAQAVSVSQEGATMIGALSGRGAFRWTRERGFEDLGGDALFLWGAADSAVAVGVRYIDQHHMDIVRLVAGGKPQVVMRGGADLSVRGVAKDGATIVGRHMVGGRITAFRWHEPDGAKDLACASPVGPTGVSGDGAVISGWALSSSSPAVVWRQGGVGEPFALRGLRVLTLKTVSADGRVVAGSVLRNGLHQAFVAPLAAGLARRPGG